MNGGMLGRCEEGVRYWSFQYKEQYRKYDGTLEDHMGTKLKTFFDRMFNALLYTMLALVF